MKSSRASRIFHLLTAMALLASSSSIAGQVTQDTPKTGSIVGKITSTKSQPLSFANIVILGTNLGSMSTQDGSFEIKNIPPERYTLKVSYLGYGAEERQVVVLAGKTVSEDFALREVDVPKMHTIQIGVSGEDQAIFEEAQSDLRDVLLLIQRNSAFALDLYHHIARSGENIAASPFSISNALAMVLEGARGQTAEAISNTTHLRMMDQPHRDFQSVLNYLSVGSRVGFGVCEVANGLWCANGEPFEPLYLGRVQTSYYGEVRQADFGEDPGAVADSINSWVSRKTRGMIPRIIEPRHLDSLTVLALVNTIYFKAQWARPFKKQQTELQPFWISPEDSVMSEMMHEWYRFLYMENEEVQMVRLPYRGPMFFMEILLPKAKDGLAQLEDGLSAEKLSRLRGLLSERGVRVRLPQFEVRSSLDLKPLLSEMGMSIAFGRNADLSGIVRGGRAFLSEALHEAVVKVDEAGTEASAATAIVATRGGVRLIGSDPVFRADHPFLFFIGDESTGSILFMGRVKNPVG